MKNSLRFLCLFAAILPLSGCITTGGDGDVNDVLDAARKAAPLLEKVAAKDARASAALALFAPQQAPAASGYPRAVTNFVERFPDGSTRLITNAIIPVLTFPPIELSPVVAPALPPIVPPGAATPPPSASGQPTPAPGGAADSLEQQVRDL